MEGSSLVKPMPPLQNSSSKKNLYDSLARQLLALLKGSQTRWPTPPIPRRWSITHCPR